MRVRIKARVNTVSRFTVRLGLGLGSGLGLKLDFWFCSDTFSLGSEEF